MKFHSSPFELTEGLVKVINQKRGRGARGIVPSASADHFRLPVTISGEQFGQALKELASYKLSIHFERVSFEPVIKHRSG